MEFRVLGRILTAQALSSLGTSISTVALAFMVYELTGSVLHMGGIMAVSTFPLVVTSFVGGALLDRFSAKTVMVLADLGRAVFIFLLPFLAEQAVGFIYLVAALMGILSAVFNPGQIKLVGDLARTDYLVRANSYLSVSRDGAELLGYLVGGVLVTYVGYTLTFSIDAGSYLLSALLLLGLPRALPRTGPVPKLGALLAETPGVVAHIWRRPLLRTNLLLAVLASGAVMMTVPNSYGLALEVFDAGASGLAALEVAMASGLILGGLAISRMRLRGDKNRYVAGAIAGHGGVLGGRGLQPLVLGERGGPRCGRDVQCRHLRALHDHVPGDPRPGPQGSADSQPGRVRSDRCHGRTAAGWHSGGTVGDHPSLRGGRGGGDRLDVAHLSPSPARRPRGGPIGPGRRRWRGAPGG